MIAEKTTKNAEEQAIGILIEQIVFERLENLRIALEEQNVNLSEALRLIEECRRHIYEDVINCGLGRGGEDGMHGFIAEWLGVYLGNAKKVVRGNIADMAIDNDNGVADYHIGSIAYQSKFSLRYLSLDSLIDHAKKYPEFVKDGNQYSIPKDFYARLKEILEIAEEDPSRLTPREMTLWKKIEQLRTEGVEIDKNVHPSAYMFIDARREHVDDTLLREEHAVRDEDLRIRENIQATHMPTIGEAAKATAIGAAFEAGTSFGLAAYEKVRNGKKIAEFTAEDWRDLGIEAVKGGGKGAIRGGAVYMMINAAKLPGAAATAAVTATFGMVTQANDLRRGSITPYEFVENSEIICLDSAISALSSIIGQIAIPVPVLGALVGNTAGTIMYEIAKGNLSQAEQKLVRQHMSAIEEQEQALASEHRQLVSEYELRMASFDSIIDLAFSEDANMALPASLENARRAGVPDSMLLLTPEEQEEFFES